ncbi:riboflavin synthase alpha chain [Desulfuromusa kysingii]|uniref:Riboflavin synthase n=1 Tax=Desulfuromusa kysingii TaxID=37625 RepID=A0A1H4D3S8_9BACT|nr:riboflavin synthase [Desulfuromusa kysingii]SEA67170.1 riboflavin synthase alpha chain [Desulfuromusa kysingii]
MFTGLIQSIGQVRALKQQPRSAQLQISSSLVNEDLQLGESIAVNGACLTVVSWDNSSFTVDVSPETLNCTTLGHLKGDQLVNLERALRLSDRLGGHLVSGHIDCIATVKRRYEDQNAIRFEFSVPQEAIRYLVEKGSVAIDGVSLTVNKVGTDMFSVAVIPHSLEMTTLKDCREGSQVNIETDLLGRYVERLLHRDKNQPKETNVDFDFLAKNGFL